MSKSAEGRSNEELREALKDLALACVEVAEALEVVDPNAPSLQQLDAALGKHMRYIGPIIKAASEKSSKTGLTTP